MDNQMEVELLNIIKYTTKDGRNRCILRFRPLTKDCIQSTDKFKGLSIIETYYNGFDIFDKIPSDLFGVRSTIVLKRTINSNNPLKQQMQVVKVNDIDLV